MYIKNQKQTDKLQRSQVGCVLGEVCEAEAEAYISTELSTLEENERLAKGKQQYLEPSESISFTNRENGEKMLWKVFLIY